MERDASECAEKEMRLREEGKVEDEGKQRVEKHNEDVSGRTSSSSDFLNFIHVPSFLVISTLKTPVQIPDTFLMIWKNTNECKTKAEQVLRTSPGSSTLLLVLRSNKIHSRATSPPSLTWTLSSCAYFWSRSRHEAHPPACFTFPMSYSPFVRPNQPIHRTSQILPHRQAKRYLILYVSWGAISSSSRVWPGLHAFVVPQGLQPFVHKRLSLVLSHERDVLELSFTSDRQVEIGFGRLPSCIGSSAFVSVDNDQLVVQRQFNFSGPARQEDRHDVRHSQDERTVTKPIKDTQLRARDDKSQFRVAQRNAEANHSGAQIRTAWSTRRKRGRLREDEVERSAFGC
ncbi:hypothetical protein BDQ12DRAFT_668504 [Crucibulum laeve]|uniref:Uncharacterized protein n=1 Tax=Crucibulum laeve TaxID=68775 RepID=A0A5C3LTW6_9AGAR|nr:hypothetical protein BDQ12DRAFT_668504 [Crucibulum laeve]